MVVVVVVVVVLLLLVVVLLVVMVVVVVVLLLLLLLLLPPLLVLLALMPLPPLTRCSIDCDGGSYSGSNDTATMVQTENGTRQIYYRGAKNLDFALKTLSKSHGMGAATDILISGDSAGGLASYW